MTKLFISEKKFNPPCTTQSEIIRQVSIFSVLGGGEVL